MNKQDLYRLPTTDNYYYKSWITELKWYTTAIWLKDELNKYSAQPTVENMVTITYFNEISVYLHV